MKKTILLTIAAATFIISSAQSSTVINRIIDISEYDQKLDNETKKADSVLADQFKKAKALNAEANKKYSQATRMAQSFDTTTIVKGDTLFITSTKAKVLVIGSKVFSIPDLGNPGTVNLNVPMQWVIANYQYLENSTGGLSKKQVEDLQQPLKGYYDYYQYLVQQQRQSQQKQ